MTYCGMSARRFMCDLNDAHERGYISAPICHNSVLKAMESEALTPILRDLIYQSSLPLKSVEVDFAIDSSGFSASRFVRWFNEKYGKEESGRAWVKVHLACGVKTNVVTAVEILDQHAADSPQFPTLVETTAQNFTINEVSGDKAYSGVANLETVAFHGGTPFVPFKSNATGAAGGLYAKMFHYFSYRREEFLQHYHKRSNVESTFSMIKAKFRDHVRSKTDVAMRNEVYCKILCHNICVLIQEMYTLGIVPVFWQDDEVMGERDVLPFVRRAN